MTALIQHKTARSGAETKPAAKLTAALVKRETLRSADIFRLPRAYKQPPLVARTLPRFQAILRSRDTRLFISVSSAAFTFILGFIG
jgi:hypothetical protein